MGTPLVPGWCDCDRPLLKFVFSFVEMTRWKAELYRQSRKHRLQI